MYMAFKFVRGTTAPAVALAAVGALGLNREMPA